MAQFAVNLVDALDPDSNITVFEYDKDLPTAGTSTTTPTTRRRSDYATHPLDRGVVYGVERQQLCLNESMVTLSQPCINTADQHGSGIIRTPSGTTRRQWGFFYTELENVGPTPVNFNNAQWQIAVKQSPIMTTTLSPYYGTGGDGPLG